MEVILPGVLVCGVRDIESKKKNQHYYFLDWYKDGAKSSIIDPEKLAAYQSLAGRVVTMKVRIEEGRDRVNYRIIDVQPGKQAG